MAIDLVAKRLAVFGATVAVALGLYAWWAISQIAASGTDLVSEVVTPPSQAPAPALAQRGN